MSRDAKIFSKIVANWIQQYIQKIIYHDQVGYFQGMQRFFNVCRSISVIHHINKRKNKNHVIISIDGRTNFWQYSASIYDKKKIVQKVGIEGTYLNRIMTICDKPTANIILSGKKLKAFTLRSGIRQECLLSPLLFNIILEVLATAVRREKRNKRNPDWKRRNKTVTLQMTWYCT